MAFAHVVPRGRRIGMVRYFAHDEASSDEWLPCDGGPTDPDEHPLLQARLAADGFPFGGDAEGALRPDLRGRSPMGTGTGVDLGDAGGAEAVVLAIDEMPSHRHSYRSEDPYDTTAIPHDTGYPLWDVLGTHDYIYTQQYTDGIAGDQPHENMQPSLVGRWMIYAGCVAVRGGGTEGPTIGEVRAFATSEEVTGWALCGEPASRADYPWLWALYASQGYPYGEGDGATTFGTPPTPGRVLMGDGTGDGLTERTIGDTVGVETVTLDVHELPEHSHPLDEPPIVLAGAVEQREQGTYPGASAIASTGESPGGDDPHNNMAPTVAMVHRVFGGTDPVPDGGLLGGMPVLQEAFGMLSVTGLLEVPVVDMPDSGLVIFIHDYSASDTWGGLYRWDEDLEDPVEIDGARVAVVAQSAGARIHVCYLDPAQTVAASHGVGLAVLWADITLAAEEVLIVYVVQASGVGNVAPTVATSAAASTNPLGPSIAVTDDTIAVLSVLGEAVSEDPMSPVSQTATPVTTFASYGSLIAADSVESGTYAATWNNPESVTACAAVVLIPRRLVP